MEPSFLRTFDSSRGASLGVLLRERGCSFGAFILMVERTESTNDLARDYARRGAPHGSLFLAEAQSRGRGRFRRTWISTRGGLHMSVLLRPAETRRPRELALLPLIASVASAEALEQTTGLTVRLRWPNDLFVEGRKLGGILCESSLTGATVDFAVVGYGVNVNQSAETFPPELAGRAVSVAMLGASVRDPLEIAAALASRLERWWSAPETSLAVDRFRALAENDRDVRVRVEPRQGASFVAVTRGVTADGGLRVELDGGSERILYSEDVVYLRDAD